MERYPIPGACIVWIPKTCNIFKDYEAFLWLNDACDEQLNRCAPQVLPTLSGQQSAALKVDDDEAQEKPNMTGFNVSLGLF